MNSSLGKALMSYRHTSNIVIHVTNIRRGNLAGCRIVSTDPDTDLSLTVYMLPPTDHSFSFSMVPGTFRQKPAQDDSYLMYSTFDKLTQNL